MRGRCLFGMAMGVALMAAGPALRAEGPGSADAGSVKTFKGAVSLLRAGQKVPVALGTRLQAQDVVQTGPDGSVGLILRDDTVLSLGPSSELALKAFAFQPKDGLFSTVLGMVKGTLVYISGRIAKLAPGAVKVETPVGVVAVRGTKLLVKIEG